MRTILLALAAVTGLGLTGASAAPNTPLDDTLVQNAWYCGPQCQRHRYWEHRRWERERWRDSHWRHRNYYGYNYPYRYYPYRYYLYGYR